MAFFNYSSVASWWLQCVNTLVGVSTGWCGGLLNTLLHGPTIAAFLSWVRRRFSKVNLLIGTLCMFGACIHAFLCWVVRTLLESFGFVLGTLENLIGGTCSTIANAATTGSAAAGGAYGPTPLKVVAFINSFIPLDFVILYIVMAVSFAITCTMLRIVKSLIPTACG